MQVKIKMMGIATLTETEVLFKDWDSPILPLIGHEIDLNIFSPNDTITVGNTMEIEDYKKYIWKVENISWTKYNGSVTPVLKVRAFDLNQ